MRARVFSIISATATLAMLLGTIVAGALGERLGIFGALWVFTIAGGLASVCPLLFPAWRDLGFPAPGRLAA
jgi:MFS family permease